MPSFPTNARAHRVLLIFDITYDTYRHQSSSPPARMVMDPPGNGPPPAKKVRVACRRCRAKRVKVRPMCHVRLDTTNIKNSVMEVSQPVGIVRVQMFSVSMWTLGIMTCLYPASEYLESPVAEASLISRTVMSSNAARASSGLSKRSGL